MTEAPCEVRIEAVTGIFGEAVPLTQGSNGVGHEADSQAEVECVAQPGAPRLKVGVAQAGEPQSLHIWKMTGKPCLLVYVDGELAFDEVRPPVGQARLAQVRDSWSIDVVCGGCALSSLQLCVERQRPEPREGGRPL